MSWKNRCVITNDKGYQRRILGVEGLDHNIKEIAELSENNEGDFHELRAENKALRRELDLLKSVVIKIEKNDESGRTNN